MNSSIGKNDYQKRRKEEETSDMNRTSNPQTMNEELKMVSF
jgi:hypothetical protein